MLFVWFTSYNIIIKFNISIFKIWSIERDYTAYFFRQIL